MSATDQLTRQYGSLSLQRGAQQRANRASTARKATGLPVELLERIFQHLFDGEEDAWERQKMRMRLYKVSRASYSAAKAYRVSSYAFGSLRSIELFLRGNASMGKADEVHIELDAKDTHAL